MSSMLCGALCALRCLLNCCPWSPCAGQRKCLVMSSVITEQLNQWRSSSGMMNLWQDACAGETHFDDVAVSEEALAKDNV